MNLILMIWAQGFDIETINIDITLFAIIYLINVLNFLNFLINEKNWYLCLEIDHKLNQGLNILRDDKTVWT